MTERDEAGLRPARILVVERDRRARDALLRLVSGEPELTVCGEAGTPAAAARLAAETWPDLILLGLDLPDGPGLDLLRLVRGWPDPPKVLVLRCEAGSAAGARAVLSGACGVVGGHPRDAGLLCAVFEALFGPDAAPGAARDAPAAA
jgi:DNA-binding NarL/FixJ family response regulator